MSQRVQIAALEAVGRKSGIIAMVLGSFLCNMAKMPLALLKAGGLLSLLVAVGMIVVADRAGRFARTEAPPRPGPNRAAALAAAAEAVREALHRHAFYYAVAAAAFLSLHLAALVHLRLFPVPA